jgi:hypothetical protein
MGGVSTSKVWIEAGLIAPRDYRSNAKARPLLFQVQLQSCYFEFVERLIESRAGRRLPGSIARGGTFK